MIIRKFLFRLRTCEYFYKHGRKSNSHFSRFRYLSQACENEILYREGKIVRSPYPDINKVSLTVTEYVWKNLDQWSDKIAVICGVSGRQYTFTELYTLSRRFATSLCKLNLESGNVLAIMLPNIPEYPIVVLGALEAGLIVSTVNPSYTAVEVEYQLKDSGAVGVVTLLEIESKLDHVVQSVELQNVRVQPFVKILIGSEGSTVGGINYEEMVSENVSVSDRKCNTKITDIAMLPYSSGTTGLSKGVLLTHANIVSNLEQFSHPNTSCIMTTNSSHQDVLPGILPFYHIYGLSVILLRGLSKGCRIITLPRFDPYTFLFALKKHKSTVLYIAPPIILFLGNHKSVTKEHFESVRYIINGAGPITMEDGEKVASKSPRKDFIFMQGYGLTETSPGVFVCPGDRHDYSSVGMCLPSTTVKVCKEDGSLCAMGENGEIYVKGPQVMRGYHNNRQATEEVFHDGYFRTGDMGYYNEEGRFFILERIKELIKVRGLQVPPAELEGILKTYPGVLESAVVGVTEEAEEKPVAFVVMENDKTVEEKILKRYVAEKVSSFKRLRRILFVESLPKNPSGKVLKRVLKENYFKLK